MQQLRFMAVTWVRNLFSTLAFTTLLSSFGALWLFVEIPAFYFQATAFPEWLRNKWWLFAMSGVVIAIIRCRPQTAVVHKLNGRDVTVKIAVGDVFSFDGAVIVGSNTTFDTRVSAKLIAENSVQGTFTKRYFTDESQLDNEIAAGLAAVQAQQLPGQRQGKSQRYPIGTVVRLNPKGRTAYFVAIADINEHGVAEGSFEKLKVSLAELWVYVGSRGLKEHLVMPALGTGFSRLPQKREVVVREIVRSFVAACSEHVFADRLTIVLSPRDVAEHQISLDELGSFLKHVCFYTEFSGGSHQAVGAPIGAATAPLAGFLSTASSFDFGSVRAGSVISKVLTFTNTGSAPMTVTRVQTNNMGECSVNGPYPSNVQPNASASLTINCAFARRRYSGQVIITSNASNGQVTVPMSGTGI